MKTKNFTLAWLSAFIVCFALGYVWHEHIMSNFYIEYSERQPNPSIDTGIFAVAYGVVTFVMTFIYSYWLKGKRSLADGLILGLVIGLLWSLPAPLIDMSYGVGISPGGIFIDTGWQMIEEGIGGVVMAWSYQYLSLQSKTKTIIFNPPL